LERDGPALAAPGAGPQRGLLLQVCARTHVAQK